MNATHEKFGFPHTEVQSFGHWTVMMRPAQATLGALVLAARSEATAFSALAPEAYAELGPVTKAVESGLSQFRSYDRINYLMLMMVDPHVHFHVFPRYATPQELEGRSFADPGWPGPPDLKAASALDEDISARILARLRLAFGRG